MEFVFGGGRIVVIFFLNLFIVLLGVLGMVWCVFFVVLRGGFLWYKDDFRVNNFWGYIVGM